MLVAQISIVFSTSSQSEPTNIDTAVPIWLNSSPFSWPSHSSPSHLTLIDVVQSSREPTVFLADNGGRPSLLIDANVFGAGRIIPLQISGKRLQLAQGIGNTLWIGGVTNERVAGIAAIRMSDAYLVRLDNQGRIAWQRTFGTKSERTIQRLVSLPSGDVVLVGKDDERTWLARVSLEGEIVWEHFFGLGKGAAVTVLDSKIYVATFDASNKSPSKKYTEDVVLRTFDANGPLMSHQVIREGINSHPDYYYFGRLFLERSNDAIYVFSVWSDSRRFSKPFEVVKIDRYDKLIWRAELPEIILQRSSKFQEICNVGVVVLASGTPMISCVIKNEMVIFKLATQTGKSTKALLQMPTPPPNCFGNWSPAKFLVERKDGVIWVFGSRQMDGGLGCTWSGQISTAHDP